MKTLLTTLLTLLLAFNINAQTIAPHPKTSVFLTISCEYEKWDGTTKDVKFTFTPDNIFGSPSNLDTTTLYNIARTAVIYADWNIKYKPTYEFRYADGSIGMIAYVDKEIAVMINGIAKNSYGMPVEVTTLVYFNTKGEMLKDKNGKYIIKTL